ncbi:helix-turn-helix domain-containing protein [bacterium]|nr:MAG: helix-turn-helix domain-containing protein [bacterium]
MAIDLIRSIVFLFTCTKIEQGLAEHPNLKTLLKLADTFGISLDELVGRKKY